LFNSESKTLSNFVNDVLQRKAAAIEFISQTIFGVSGEEAGWNER
jgi:hypothetical protein